MRIGDPDLSGAAIDPQLATAVALGEATPGDPVAAIPYPPAKVAWRAVFALLFLYALAMVDRQVLSLMVAPIRSDLHVSDLAIGLLQGLSFSILFCFCGLPFGYAVDRFPRRMIILVGVLIWAIATTLSGFATHYGELFVARIFVGMGEAALGPAAFSMLSDLFPPKKLTFALSIYSMGSLIGGALAMALSGWAVAAASQGHALLEGFTVWQQVFVIVGAPGLILAFVVFLFPEPVRRGHRADQASWTDLYRFISQRKRFFIAHLGGFSCMMTVAYANLGWTPTFLVRSFGWTIPQVASVLSVFQLSVGITCFLISGRLVDWMWRRGYYDAHFRFFGAATALAAIAGCSAFLMPSPKLYFATIAFAALATNLAAIAPAALQIVTPNELRGRVSAVYLLVTGLVGMTLGPALVSGLTVYVFADDSKLYLSLSLVYGVVASMSCLFFLSGLRPMREAYAARAVSDDG